MVSFFRLRIFWFLLLSGISIFAILLGDSYDSFFRNLAFSTSNVLRNLTGRSAVWIEDISQKFIARKSVQRENEVLKQKIREYEERLQSISSLQFENGMLRSILEFSLSIDYNLLPAQIIAMNGKAENIQSILLNRGRTNGVRKNMAVVGIHENDLVVVGSISDITFYTAQVIPITHESFSIPAQTSQSAQRGILSGYGTQDGHLLFTSDSIYDGNSKFIFVGEKIFVNAYSKFLPRGMLIGSVVKVSSDIEDSISRSYVQPYLMPAKLDYVFVIIPKETNDKNVVAPTESTKNENALPHGSESTP